MILVTNDDGITAPGLRNLIRFLEGFGDLYVVAPDSPQSGMGHAITVDSTLYIKKSTYGNSPLTQAEYSTSGTPADCVKLAMRELLPRRPDLCVSGINHGTNSSINVIYSGTMSAAVEAGIEGIPAIGFSLCNYAWEASFEHCREVVQTLVREALKNSMPTGTVLNVNIPDTPEIAGIRVCRQARGNYREKFDKRTSPSGKEYYWLTGEFELLDEGEDTDIRALEQGYVSVVPTQFDMTAHYAISQVNNWSLET